MQTISVYLNKGTPALHAAFRSSIVSVSQKVCTDPVMIHHREQELGQLERFTFSAWSSGEYTLATRDVVRSFVAIVISEWVVHAVEPVLTDYLLKRECALRQIESTEDIRPFLQVDHADVQRAKIYKKVYEYLDQEDSLNLGGFIRFRLKEYVQVLKEATISAIDEFLEEKQYKEFVALLRHFISIQEAQCEVIHVVASENQEFLLYDHNEQPVILPQLDHLRLSGEGHDRDEDFLISALMTLAPKRIVLHSLDDQQMLMQTLVSLYGERISQCSACAHCLRLTINNPFTYNR
ncbi:UNVERIFIED_CONTAM: putative sporulation protein YtxC [Brevibacillus sp. OAP136]